MSQKTRESGPVGSRAAWGLYCDFQIVQNVPGVERGTVRYCFEHAKAMVKVPGLVKALGFNPMMPLPAAVPEVIGHERLQWSTAANFRRARLEGPIAYHLMSPYLLSQFDSFLPPFAARPEIPLILTLTDLLPFTDPDAYFAEPNVARRCRMRLELIRSADLVLTISEHTRSEASEKLGLDPARLVSIGSGVSSYFHPPGAEDDPAALLHRQLPAVRKPFILSVTGMWERKNTERLIEAYAALSTQARRNLQLVIVCRLNDDYRLRWTDHASRLNLRRGELVLTDMVPDPVLRALYQTAHLFVFPSLYEGFGLPAAEAAACGCPTILSRTSSMPEVLGFRPATFDPSNAASMSSLIERALFDADYRERLTEVALRSARRNTWQAVAEKTRQALDSLPDPAKRQNGHAGGEPGMVALIAGGLDEGMHPEARMQIIQELARLCRLDLFSHQDHFGAGRSFAAARRFPIEAFGRNFNPAGYDAVILLLQGNGADARVRELGLAYGGIVWAPPAGPSTQPTGRLEWASRLFESSPAVIVDDDKARRLFTMAAGPGARMPLVEVVRSAGELLRFVQKTQSRTLKR